MKNYYISLLSNLLFIILFSNNIQAQSGTVSIGSGSTKVELEVSLDTTNSLVSIKITGDSSRWFGFGFGANTMATGAYTVIGNVSGNAPQEYNQANHAAPILQMSQNLSLVSNSTTLNYKVYTISRSMNTLDANDFIFYDTTTTFDVVWAYGATTTMAQHAGRGSVTMVLTNPCNIPNTVLPDLHFCQGDSVLVFGTYRSQAGTYSDTLQSNNGCDSVLIQPLIQESGFYSSLADTTICNGDSVMVFGSWVKQGGTYFNNDTTIYGCDSIYSKKVNLIVIDTTVYVSNNQLYAAYAFADNYQWYDCQNNQAITGENNLNFLPLQDGNYKVAIQFQQCSDTSNCHLVNWTSVESALAAPISIGPNPVENKLLIDIPYYAEKLWISIFSIDGKKLGQYELHSGLNTLNLSSVESGLYIYQVHSESDNVKIGRFVKQ